MNIFPNCSFITKIIVFRTCNLTNDCIEARLFKEVYVKSGGVKFGHVHHVHSKASKNDYRHSLARR